MKTAKQLQEIVVKNKGISMSAIEYHCTKAAENGATSVMIFDREISARDLLTLEYKGIKVDRFNDDEGFHYELSWPDNTINISTSKDSWSREEVVELLYKHTEYMLSGKKDTLDKWIEENL